MRCIRSWPAPACSECGSAARAQAAPRRHRLRAQVDFCRAHNVALLPYGVMAGGFLSERYLDLDAAKVSVDTSSKQKYASVLRKVRQAVGKEGSPESLCTRGDVQGVCLIVVRAQHASRIELCYGEVL